MSNRRPHRLLPLAAAAAAAAARLPSAHAQLFTTILTRGPGLTSLRPATPTPTPTPSFITIATADAAVSSSVVAAGVTDTGGTASASSTAFVSSGGQPEILFATVPTLTACRSTIISWSLVNDSPRNVLLDFFVANFGVAQVLPSSLVSAGRSTPALSNSATSSLPVDRRRSDSLHRRTMFPVNQTIAANQPALSFLTWTVSVPEGQYYITAVGDNGATGQSANFYVVEGADTSCLASFAAMTSSVRSRQSAALASTSASASASSSPSARASGTAAGARTTNSLSSGLSGGAIAGIVVGIAAVIALLLGILLCLRRRHTRGRFPASNKSWSIASLPALFRYKRGGGDDTQPTPWIQHDAQPDSTQSSKQTFALGDSPEVYGTAAGASGSPTGSDEKKRGRGEFGRGAESYDVGSLEKAYTAWASPRDDLASPARLPPIQRQRSVSESFGAAPDYMPGQMGAGGYLPEKVKPFAVGKTASESSLATSERPGTTAASERGRGGLPERPVSTPSAMSSPAERHSPTSPFASTNDGPPRARHGHPKQRAWGSQGSIPVHMLPRLPTSATGGAQGDAIAGGAGEGADLVRRPSGSIRRKPVPPLLGEIVPTLDGAGCVKGRPSPPPPPPPPQTKHGRSGSRQYVLAVDQPLSG